jgi:carbon monoxide dehydrogenase subunit G
MSARIWLAGFAAVVIAPGAYADVELHEAPDHVTEGTVTIDATPQQIYELVTDYANWQQTFTDIQSVQVESGGRDTATVRFRSRALEHTVTVTFANTPGKTIRFRGTKGPGRAQGEYDLVAIDGGKRTQVKARLYMDVRGPASLFVRDKRLRAMREAKLRADLGDVERHFAMSR